MVRTEIYSQTTLKLRGTQTSGQAEIEPPV